MTEAEWKRFREMKDKDIDTSDIPELDEDFFKNAKLVIPQNKEPISLRVDKDVLAWFKAQGKGYQSLMNSVLRYYVETKGQKPLVTPKRPSAKKVAVKTTSKHIKKS